MNEHGYIRAIHRNLPTELYVWKTNVRFVNGIPDAWYSGDRSDLWIEYKWLARTPGGWFTPKLSALQAQWLRERYREGRPVAVIIGTPSGGTILQDREWEARVAAPESWLKHVEVARWIATQCISV